MKLEIDLTNPSYSTVAQIAHLLTGYAVALTALKFHHLYLVGALYLVAVCAKEFWFDMQIETSNQSGGIWGSVEDFCFYLIGFGVGWIV